MGQGDTSPWKAAIQNLKGGNQLNCSDFKANYLIYMQDLALSLVVKLEQVSFRFLLNSSVD